MNSFDARLKKLESYKSLLDDKPLRSPSFSSKNNPDFQKNVQNKIRENEQKNIDLEMSKITTHYITGIKNEHSLTSIVDYTIRYIELNCEKIAKLLRVECTSLFKQTTALNFIRMFQICSEFSDSNILELIDYSVSLLFKKIVEPVVLIEDPPNKKNKKKFLRF
jgi:hypothetical protein